MRKKKPELPVWLRRLSRVKEELRGYEWPTRAEGLRQGMALMAMGLEALEKSASSSKVTVSETLAAFARADARWVARWRKERVKVFPR